MIKTLLKRALLVSLIIVLTVIGHRIYQVQKLKQHNRSIHERLDTYLKHTVLSNNIDYPENVDSVIQNIDDAIECIMSPDAIFLSHSSDVPSTCLLKMSHNKLGDRIVELYNSDSTTYHFIAAQFPMDDKDWYYFYFRRKTTIEVLLELSVLKQQLIIAHYKPSTNNEG